MIELYLLVSLAGGTPKVTGYQTEAQACAEFGSQPGAHIYKVEASKRDEPKLTEGLCAPVQQFVTQGK